MRYRFKDTMLLEVNKVYRNMNRQHKRKNVFVLHRFAFLSRDQPIATVNIPLTNVNLLWLRQRFLHI